MLHCVRVFAVSSLLATSLAIGNASADLNGTYMEARTCQVYTGPCFANGEVGLAGKDAVMAWNVDAGQYAGVDVGGLNVVVILRASDTLGFRGIADVADVRSVIIVDSRADSQQHRALVEFARHHIGKAGDAVKKVVAAPVEMKLDTTDLSGSLKAGDAVQLTTRKARKGDCICSNESAYYPPLAQVENFAPGVTIQGRVKARSLGTTWSIPDSRTAYMATFAY